MRSALRNSGVRRCSSIAPRPTLSVHRSNTTHPRNNEARRNNSEPRRRWRNVHRHRSSNSSNEHRNVKRLSRVRHRSTRRRTMRRTRRKTTVAAAEGSTTRVQSIAPSPAAWREKVFRIARSLMRTCLCGPAGVPATEPRRRSDLSRSSHPELPWPGCSAIDAERAAHEPVRVRARAAGDPKKPALTPDAVIARETLPGATRIDRQAGTPVTHVETAHAAPTYG